jgi:hypothetical protein
MIFRKKREEEKDERIKEIVRISRTRGYKAIMEWIGQQQESITGGLLKENKIENIYKLQAKYEAFGEILSFMEYCYKKGEERDNSQ